MTFSVYIKEHFLLLRDLQFGCIGIKTPLHPELITDVSQPEKPEAAPHPPPREPHDAGGGVKPPEPVAMPCALTLAADISLPTSVPLH